MVQQWWRNAMVEPARHKAKSQLLLVGPWERPSLTCRWWRWRCRRSLLQWWLQWWWKWWCQWWWNHLITSPLSHDLLMGTRSSHAKSCIFAFSCLAPHQFVSLWDRNGELLMWALMQVWWLSYSYALMVDHVVYEGSLSILEIENIKSYVCISIIWLID